MFAQSDLSAYSRKFLSENGIYSAPCKEYAEQYHLERDHQGLDNAPIAKLHGAIKMDSAVVRHERLGGLLNYYEGRAA